MDLEPLLLPTASPEPTRARIPVLAAVVPLIGGVVMWLVTGSLFALCFAALGPLMIGASALDGVRGRKKERRRAAREESVAWQQAEAELVRVHAQEVEHLRRRHRDAAGCLREAPLRDRSPVDAQTSMVIGAGHVRSGLRTSGGAGARAADFRARAAVLEQAPLTVPLGRGLCLRGPGPVIAAVARALLVQLCLTHPASSLALLGEGLDDLGLGDFPHAQLGRTRAWRIALVREGERPPVSDAHLWLCAPGADVPEGVTTVVDCVHPLSARVRTATEEHEIAAEGLSLAQARIVAARSARMEQRDAVLPTALGLAELVQPTAEGNRGLAVRLGRALDGDPVLDLVADGPHAIVTGMTGAGKSELLASWIVAIAGAHAPEEVVFVLADFKGGSAFEPLRAVPHVAAVITDLDAEEARRGVQSLTAELRRREGVLAAAGARSIDEDGVRLPRLVIVVDEFAALLQEHDDLAAVFTDLAARGRALGMHLILGTQRATGVIRDALAANCPLRLSLRVAEAADSRLVIGSDAAAELPGGADSRGLAFLRRPQDIEPQVMRVARAGDADREAVRRRWAGSARPSSPWLPPLPERIELEELAGRGNPGGLLLGLADEPDQQRQPVIAVRPGTDRGLALVGGSGSGRSTALRTLAAQEPESVWIPDDPEQAWDILPRLADPSVSPPALVLCDDLDLLLAAFPPEYASAFLERCEQFVRSAGVLGCTVVITAARGTGPVARVLDALPERLLLRVGGKLEHISAGGEPDGFRRDRPPGRARHGDRELQLAWTPEKSAPGRRRSRVAAWEPGESATAVVAGNPAHVTRQLRAAFPACEVVALEERAPGVVLAGTSSSAGAVASSPAPLSSAFVDPARAAAPGAGTIIVGDPEGWQRNWTLAQRIRSDGELLILAECASEVRTIGGHRELPPYARKGAGRAWSIVAGDSPRRVLLRCLDATVRESRGARRPGGTNGGTESVSDTNRVSRTETVIGGRNGEQ